MVETLNERHVCAHVELAVRLARQLEQDSFLLQESVLCAKRFISRKNLLIAIRQIWIIEDEIVWICVGIFIELERDWTRFIKAREAQLHLEVRIRVQVQGLNR